MRIVQAFILHMPFIVQTGWPNYSSDYLYLLSVNLIIFFYFYLMVLIEGLLMIESR